MTVPTLHEQGGLRRYSRCSLRVHARHQLRTCHKTCLLLFRMASRAEGNTFSSYDAKYPDFGAAEVWKFATF